MQFDKMEFVGRKVKVELQDGSVYDGFVHSYNTNIGKLSLEKVTCQEDNERRKLVGLQHYFVDEIADIIADEEVLRNKSKGPTLKERGHGVLQPKYSPAHLQKLKYLEPASLLLKNQRGKDGLTSSGNESTGSDSDGGDAVSNKDHTILQKTNTLFNDALSYIKKHQVIGMAMEGVSIGREGQLCWIQIAVPDHVFLFDMLRLGQDGFNEGLASVLESEDILKVIHNCRMMSDLLHHQYNISLVNVFDTQVANVFVYRLWHQNDWPRYVDGLSTCLVQHLDLTMEEVNWSVVRERFRESDEEVWLERPPRKNLIEALVKNVKHLIALRQVLMEKMMEEFVAGVNIYLSHVRDGSEGDARRYQKEPYLLPVAFQDIRQFMISYASKSRFNRARNDTLNDVKLNGFRENVTSIRQPDVYFSRDSLWHAGARVKGHKSLGRYADTVADLVPNSKAPSSSRPHQGDDKTTVDSNSHIVSGSPNVEAALLHSDRNDEDRQNNGEDRQKNGEEVSQLTGTSLMRALIQEQSPEGGEDHSDIEGMNIMPAGQMVGKNVKMPRSSSARNPVVIPDLSNYPSTGGYRKTLTDQERRMVAQMGRKTSQTCLHEAEESDSVLAPPLPREEYSAGSVHLRAQEMSLSPNLPSSNSLGPSASAASNGSPSYQCANSIRESSDSLTRASGVRESSSSLTSALGIREPSNSLTSGSRVRGPFSSPASGSGISESSNSPANNLENLSPQRNSSSQLQTLLALIKKKNG